MLTTIGAGILTTALTLSAATGESGAPPINLRVLYVGTSGSDRASAYEALLKQHFVEAKAADRDTFDPKTAAGFDVVLLDWSQSDVNAAYTPDEKPNYRSPLGPRESWSTPTVLLGSAGLLITSPWQTNGSYGCTCMHPFAYNMRDHEVFQTPISIDRAATIKRHVPNDSWREKLGVKELDVLALVHDIDGPHKPGWCTYEYTLAEQPDVEFISGGVNDKIPAAVGVWRQGNLMHFGFDLHPIEMTDVCKSLLVNAIVYIAKFTEDRPIVQAPSPFYATATRARSAYASWIAKGDYQLKWFEEALDPDVRASVTDHTREGYQAWFAEISRWLRPNATGLLTWDDEARTLGINYSAFELFDRGIEALREPSTRAQAATLLHRYMPDGPAGDDVETWTNWYAENKPFLFYCEWANYRWYIDPLAKARGIPSADLRGPARADP